MISFNHWGVCSDMLKRKKKNEDTSAEEVMGISGEKNRLNRAWLYTTLAVLVPLVAGFVFLLLVRDASLQREQLTRAAAGHAVQQAAHIEQLLIQYQARLQAAASAPLALSAIASGREEDLALVEKAMLDYFPGLASLRLVAIGELGTAALRGGGVGLRNHIEMDLLRRTGEGEQVTPESYQFEGRWLTSMAQNVQHPRQPARRAVILATLDNQVIADSLSSMGAELGRSSLHQLFTAGMQTRSHEIAAAGNGAADQFSAEARLNQDTWMVRFTPSAQMLSLYRVSNLPVLICLAALFLTMLLAMIYFLRYINRSLAAEVEQMMGGAERKASYQVGIPALLPAARHLRKLTLQKSTPANSRAAQAAQEQEEAAAGAASEGVAARPKASKAAAAPTTVPEHIFRAYDIRGIVEKELTEDLIARIGRALGTLAEAREQQALIVGCDGRTSSPAIKNMLVKALLDTGRDVVDIGLVPTPALHYATETLSTKSGVMVTASHNPADYNGFKITLGGKPFAGDDLLMLRQTVGEGKFSRGAGRLAKQDIKGDYCDAIVNDIAITTALKIVVDAGNGAAGDLAPRVLEALGCEVVKLYCEIDGTFPNHHPDPGVDENLADLRAKVVEEGADFGVAYDGDGDRLTVVTPGGDIVRNDTLLMLFAEDIVSRNPGADVIFDVKCSQQLTHLVSKHGGRPVIWRTGHSFMRNKVRETGALLGGEFSGHIYFGERWFGFDDAIYATARLSEIISGTGMDLPSLLAEFPQTANTPEIKIPMSEKDKFAVMRKLAESADFSPGKVTNLDGIRVDYNDGWGLVRASNTTPALTARFEGNSAEALERIQEQFRSQLKQAVPSLDVPF
jgi:phosphomannomutase/phosphoglucomutase